MNLKKDLPQDNDVKNMTLGSARDEYSQNSLLESTNENALIDQSNGTGPEGRYHSLDFAKFDYNKGEYLLKRPFDIALSSVGLVLSFPLWTAIATVIWLEDKGAIFYTSDRIGKHGKTFKSFKFRTMIQDSDERFGPLQAKQNDPRITKVGRILRNTAMDELPQLFNILRGDMSFVGPRPLLPSEIEVNQNTKEKSYSQAHIRGHKERHSVTPGLTGIAQVFAPRDIIRERKFRYDLLYIKKQSLKLDLKLIFLSFWITFRGKWESRNKKF